MTAQSPRFPVAPDVEPRRLFNRIVIRPQRRITLRLGRIEDLFPDLPDSDRGRMARLQVLGLFYFPLDHWRVPDAFAVCWKWVKEKILHVKSSA